MRLFVTILSLTFLAACNPREYEVLSNFDPVGKRVISMGDEYDFYKRKVFRVEESSGDYSLATKGTQGSNEGLMEVEYLLLSRSKGILIYITTIPRIDPTYYENNSLPDETMLNAHDFNTFHIGKIIGEGEVQFNEIKGRKKHIWDYTLEENTLSIERIITKEDDVYQDEHSVKNSIQGGAVFTLIDSYEIVFKEGNSDIRDSAEELYIFQRGKRKKFCVFMKFDGGISKRIKMFQAKEGIDSTTIVFRGKKSVPYNPFIVFDP